ncbi:uncharacterized protein [Bos taurus]|uniref:uncharacterized protein isoform X2 n=1 Tax=Bos taurus TaxID=9913 RepID=UPI0028CB8AE5|nr:uncharacterized protein LOC132345313 isoform X2 [Bos taurus]
MPHFSKAWKMTLLEWLGAARCFFIPGCFLASHLSASGAGWWGWGGWCRGTRQARVIVAPLSDWLTPQWAPPPSKRPLVSNSPPETVSGPTQPLFVSPDLLACRAVNRVSLGSVTFPPQEKGNFHKALQVGEEAAKEKSEQWNLSKDAESIFKGYVEAKLSHTWETRTYIFVLRWTRKMALSCPV